MLSQRVSKGNTIHVLNKKESKKDVKVPEGANMKVNLFHMMGSSNRSYLHW